MTKVRKITLTHAFSALYLPNKRKERKEREKREKKKKKRKEKKERDGDQNGLAWYDDYK
jgi:hypothetical protein